MDDLSIYTSEALQRRIKTRLTAVERPPSAARAAPLQPEQLQTLAGNVVQLLLRYSPRPIREDFIKSSVLSQHCGKRGVLRHVLAAARETLQKLFSLSLVRLEPLKPIPSELANIRVRASHGTACNSYCIAQTLEFPNHSNAMLTENDRNLRGFVVFLSLMFFHHEDSKVSLSKVLRSLSDASIVSLTAETASSLRKWLPVLLCCRTASVRCRPSTGGATQTDSTEEVVESREAPVPVAGLLPRMLRQSVELLYVLIGCKVEVRSAEMATELELDDVILFPGPRLHAELSADKLRELATAALGCEVLGSLRDENDSEEGGEQS